MFDSTRPPLLVLPIPTSLITLFPTHEGYNIHPIDNDQILVSYKQGWTMPLSIQIQKFAAEEPLLLVRDKGGITAGASTSDVGYSHQFCSDDGNTPDVALQCAIFPDRPNEQWMLIHKSVTVIWVQYSSSTQYLGGEGHDMEHHYSGKLIVKNFAIRHEFAPRIDRASDTTSESEKQYRIEGRTIFENNWNLTDRDVAEYLGKLLPENGLECYIPAAVKALNRSMQTKRI